MTIYTGINYKQTVPKCKDGDEFHDCNLGQHTQKTIGKGVTGLKFKDCSLLNLTLPTDAIVESCNIFQPDYCYWIHPDWDDLPVEEADCRHVKDEYITTVDGGDPVTAYEREDGKHGA